MCLLWRSPVEDLDLWGFEMAVSLLTPMRVRDLARVHERQERVVGLTWPQLLLGV
jgi:hypothetical protein